MHKFDQGKLAAVTGIFQNLVAQHMKSLQGLWANRVVYHTQLFRDPGTFYIVNLKVLVSSNWQRGNEGREMSHPLPIIFYWGDIWLHLGARVWRMRLTCISKERSKCFGEYSLVTYFSVCSWKIVVIIISCHWVVTEDVLYYVWNCTWPYS